MKKTLALYIAIVGLLLLPCIVLGSCNKPEAHNHCFDQEKADDEYLASEATCESAPTYYYSCVCGARGEKTFSHGNPHRIVQGQCSICKKFESSPGLNFTLNEDQSSYTLVSAGSFSGENLIVDMYNGLPVTHLSDNSLEYIKKLKSVTIGSSVTKIGKGVFKDCIRLESITLPFVGAEKTGEENTHFGYIFGAQFASKNPNFVPASLETVIINDDDSISDYAFQYCTNIKSITLPNGITRIGLKAFEGCEKITNLVIPDSVTEIGFGAFLYCSALESLTIPFVGNQAKVSSSHIIYFFGSSQVAFNGGYSPPSGLSTIIITKATKIGPRAFYGCSNIKTVEIPDTVTTIETSAFEGCTGIESITIPRGVTNIGADAFKDCSNLANITIPYTVSSIQERAFLNCNNLTINCEASKQPARWNNYWNESNCPVNWKYNSITSNPDYDYVIDGNKAGLVHYKGNASHLTIPSTIDGYVVSNFSTAFIGNSDIVSVAVPEHFTVIPRCSFYACENLESITLSDSIVSIGSEAFSKCSSLKSINVPDSVKTVGAHAFIDCSNLVTATIGSGVEYINMGLFANCTSLESVTLSGSVTVISDFAFDDCSNLSSINIPDTVEIIGSQAFCNCINLEKIIIPESVSQISHSAFSGCTKLTIYCRASSEACSEFDFGNIEVIWDYQGD